MAQEFVEFIKANEIKPAIAETFAFEDVRRSLEVLAKQSEVGKLVIRVGGE